MNKVIIVPSMLSYTNGNITTNQGTYRIVPDIIAAPTTLSVTNGSGYPQTVTIQPAVTATATSAFTIDPLADHMAWYGFPPDRRWAPTFVRELTLVIDKLTNMHEFSRMVDDAVKDVVLVQKCNYDSWQMFFRSDKDKLAVDEILGSFKVITIALTKFPDDLTVSNWTDFANEARAWGRELGIGPHRIEDSFHSLTGFFRNEEDAALFKLKYTYA